MAKTEIVVIGGGTGAGMVHDLLPGIDPTRHNVTLINPYPYSLYLPMAARIVVTADGTLEKTGLLPFDTLISRVTRVADGVVDLENGEVVKYDYLVVATGCSWEGPIDFPDSDALVKEHISLWRKKFASASSVVIIGGGSAGIELASEIKHYHPDTKVTIVHSPNMLVNDTYPKRFRKSLEARVRKFGVDLLLGDRLEVPPEGQRKATTSNGVTLEADLFISCRGTRPNTSILKSLDSSILTSSGHVKVLPTLQVPLQNGKTNVFAMGDIIEWKEQRQYAKAMKHKSIVAKNIIAALNGWNPPVRYKGSEELLAVSIGPNAGRIWVPRLWGMTMGDFVSKRMKSATLAIHVGRKGMGL
ncbi:hypothetical protein BS47DRAFT_1375404 [Hydnum rufescens UP504]|uniref:FAD/NAD(P)-binding domain-containing protein n=1 Tax=Hydnum rufescens UP504 TaxID=1448309 RepID=A0A9P6DX95_9AGAM|nr:hypothetical protein BS47DRAFT_1375404 [Hydnum rufescens UP504]